MQVKFFVGLDSGHIEW